MLCSSSLSFGIKTFSSGARGGQVRGWQDWTLCPQLPRSSVSQFSVIPELVISCDEEDGGDGTFPMLPQLTGPGALACKCSTWGFHPNPAREEQVFLLFFLKGVDTKPVGSLSAPYAAGTWPRQVGPHCFGSLLKRRLMERRQQRALLDGLRPSGKPL